MVRAIWLLVSATLAYGQAGKPRPVFEVASIKPSPPPAPGMGMRVGTSGGPGTADPGRWSAQNYSLRNLIYTAYNLKSYELAAPDWTNSERFDIVAKVPEGASRDDLRLMIEALLEDRFKLTFHREPKEMATYDLVIARNGPKLKEPAPPPAAKQDAPLPSAPLKTDAEGYPILRAGRGMSMAIMNGKARMVSTEVTMSGFASQLSGQVGKPVKDATGLTGKYDIILSWAPDGARALPPPPPGAPAPVGSPEAESGPTIFSALQEQLGLRLEQKKGTVEILVVDKLEKTPTEN